MRRWLAVAAIGFVLSFGLCAQERERPQEASGEMTGWKWANFAILVAGLAYLAARTVPAFLRARQDAISRGIEAAARKKQEAETRAAEIERRLANIGQDIDNLRGEIQREMQAESERLRHETERLLQRIEDQTQQEISHMTKAAIQQLQIYSSGLALDLAGERIKQQMNRQIQQDLVDDFVSGLRQQTRESVSV